MGRRFLMVAGAAICFLGLALLIAAVAGHPVDFGLGVGSAYLGAGGCIAGFAAATVGAALTRPLPAKAAVADQPQHTGGAPAAEQSR